MPTHPFDSLLSLDTAAVRLDCAALHLARGVYEHISIPKYLGMLDNLAEHVSGQRPGLSAVYRYQAMRQVLVEDFELRGNADDYYDPENSYLNRVLDRGLGIPVSLSTVWIEVARRLKWPVVGVGFPGSFLVRFDDEDRYVLVDPFRAGRALSVTDCERILAHHFDGKVKFSPELLAPVDTRQVLARTLQNLRSIYAVNQDWERLEYVLERLAAVEPQNGQVRRERAALACRRGRMRAAYEQLASYLRDRPDAEDSAVVQENLREIAAAIATYN
ncbi:MAG: tetratricopeptide repeat protein [Phycisphaerae bacterium]|jgi:regulator of sirC expression with transglutaminase-like and TPR domain